MSPEQNELDTQSFNSNYQVLKDTADWLARQDDPDIDALVPRIERALQAYQICRQRIEKVQAALEQLLPPEAEDAPEG
ncbi:MAG: exodeoxyribonuclease VII small subunit [Deltaproteobacteria bacterium]|nr:exodeoxyribonuclease VII small subunit [Deltaproteobacteria bacterium]